ncbi:hypothetical protein SKAU_G00206170 [Synaphobranchus kaupii]|uniref:Uncharacterized protein n=1 Tax=Synaphobranchus kaupii TaxID=118154 RepID=A0A9Q1FGY6_SYNKA|nr:hypothetical protein SKAU_G00206170 [Synaphobranchus kaupii]
MYLYRASCNNIPSPRQRGAPRPERSSSRFWGPSGACCRAGQRPDPQQELRQVEEFLRSHGLSLHSSDRAQNGMPYRSQGLSGLHMHLGLVEGQHIHIPQGAAIAMFERRASGEMCLSRALIVNAVSGLRCCCPTAPGLTRSTA